MKKDPRLIVVGSVSLDTIETPDARRPDILGGSAPYACAAASLFTPTGLIGIVGDDFPAPYRRRLLKRGVDLAGLQVATGKTFRWSGVYERNMNNRRTVSTDLNVFADFHPRLPDAYRSAPLVFLANIAPALQLEVLAQTKRPRFVAADTMDLWINITPDDLRAMIARVDLLALNESEARHLTGRESLLRAAREVLTMGPSWALIKKGEHGAMLVGRRSVFSIPAWPVEDVVDPTGAGDSFAGAMMGHLATESRIDENALRRALARGTAVASHTVSAFSLDALWGLKRQDIDRRVRTLRRMAAFD